ncbi:hypothetical protein D3C85_1317830 [compost metagenome]
MAGNAGAEGHAQGPVVQLQRGGGQSLAQVLGDAGGLLGAGVGQQHGELLAAEAAEQITAAQPLRQETGEMA